MSGSSRLIISAIIGCVIFIIALLSGQVAIPWSEVAAILGYQMHVPQVAADGFLNEHQWIVWYIRLPRILVALLTGSALALAGAVMQAVFNNALAEPGLLGAGSGAALGAVSAIASGLAFTDVLYMPMFAGIGAMSAVMLTMMLAVRQQQLAGLTLLLAGLAVGIFLGGIIAIILTFINEQQLQQYLFWMVGGLEFRRWEHVYLILGPVVVGIILLLLLARHLNIIALGSEAAAAVGVAVLPLRLVLLFIASLLTAGAICVGGNIGFVGLVIPHHARMLVGPDHRVLLPACAVGGGIFLLVCDTIGRTVLAPHEIRVGIMTAVVGVPYFLYVLRTRRINN